MAGAVKGKNRATGLLGELATFSDQLFVDGFEVQCGALCYRRNPVGGEIEILLVTSRETQRWIIPKGWPVKGKTLHRSAEIEAWEEAGVRGHVRKKPFGHFTYIKASQGAHPKACLVTVFLLEVQGLDAAFREKGQRRIEWMSCVEASRRVRETELKGLILQAERRLRTA